MNFAGISTPIGITFYGDHYRATVREPISIRGTKIHRGDAKIIIKKATKSNPIYTPIAIFVGIDLLLIAYCLITSASINVRFSNPSSILDYALTGIFICGMVALLRTTRGYHGAEHKVIAAAENNDVDMARAYSPIHPRCGTNLLLPYVLLTIVISRSFFPMFGVPMAISYMAMKHAPPVQRVFGAAGGILQKITTTEPTERELNNAIRGMRALMDAEGRRTVVK